MIPFGKRPKKLPTVLGQDEVHDLIQCVDNPKHRAVLITLYAAGLRLAEATGLKLPEVDSQRMQLKINGGKGSKDRYGAGADQQASDTAYAPAFLRDRLTGSGSRLDGDQQAAGAQQFSNHDGLPALSTSALGRRSEPAGLTVFSLLKQYTAAFIKKHQDRLSCHVESTLLRMSFCRTAAMKGHLYRCPSCDWRVNVYNSCTDRHCPQCMGARRADWVNKTSQLLRPGTEYFQIVFTLPQALSSLALGNRQQRYRLLFRSAADSLQRSIADECGMQAAATMVLHTWNQRLGHHPHVHALVPGSGPSLDGTRWVPCRSTKATGRKPARPFLVDNKELGRRFRDHYVRSVRRLIKAGTLQVEDSVEVNKILSEVEA